MINVYQLFPAPIKHIISIRKNDTVRKSILAIVILTGFFVTQVKAQLKADFSASDSSGCVPLAVAFRNLSQGNPDSSRWEVGDGLILVLRDPGLLYLNPGSYTVKLTVYKGKDSATITKPNFINVYQFPTVDFSASPLEGCKPLPVRFTNRSVPGSGTIAQSIWDFGDGASGTGNNPLHRYNITGQYSVTLSVTNSFGCRRTLTIPSMVRVYDTVKANFSFVAESACQPPFRVNFENKSIGVGIVSQKWDFGDGTTSTDKDPTHLFNKVGMFTITLISTNSRGCSDTVKQSINLITGNFSSSFQARDSVCRGPLVTFTNTSNPLNRIDSVLWDFGDGTFSRTISPNKGYATPGDYTVKLTNYFGACQVTTTRSIKVLPGLQTAFSGGPVLETCRPPLTVTFKNETIGARSLRWRINDTTRVGSDLRTATFSDSGTYDIRLITESAQGCFDTLVKRDYVKILPLKIQRIPGLPFQGCFPFTQTLRPVISSVSPVVKWEWDFGDGRTSNEETPRITYDQRGIYTIKLRVTNQEGCTNEAEFTVQGGYPPKPDFSADPLLVCTSGEVSFTGTVKGPYTQLLWTFGDGGKAVDTLLPINIYKDTGYMDVTFYAYDFGCVDSVIKKKYIYVSPPYADFNVTGVCNNRYQRVFKDSSFGGDIWLWEFGDGNTSSEINPTYTYQKPGSYNVTLTVTKGLCSHSKSIVVNIMDDFPDFNFVENSSCRENTLNISAGGTNLNLSNITEYSWRFSDNVSFRGTNPTITRSFTDFANLTLRLVITDRNGCSRSITKPLQIKLGGPKARIKPDSILVCAGRVITFPDSSARATNTNIVKWTWNFGIGPDRVFSTPTFEYRYDSPGTYDLRLKVEDNNGCVDSIFLRRAVRVFNAKADFWSSDTIVCPNTPVKFNDVSSGTGLRYKWSFGDGTTSTDKFPQKSYAAAGEYDITLEITDTAKCVYVITKPKYIKVGGIEAKFLASDTFASCPPLVVSFTNQSKGAVSYSWDFGNGNTSILENPVQTFNSINEFFTRLIVTGNGGCKDTAIQRIYIQGPTGEITYGPLSGCPPITVNFTSNAKNVKSFIWDFSDGTTFVSIDPNATHTYLNPGTYRPRVILEDGDNCRVSILGKEEIKVVGVRSLIQTLPGYTYCDSALIQFSDSSLTNDLIKTWRWDFGDGTFSDKQNPAHLYNKPGRYKVKLFVETFDGCTSITTLFNDVVIAASPKFSLLSDSTGCLPVEMKFELTNQRPDTTALSYKWDFKNGTTSILQNPDNVFYDKPGKYLVSVAIEDNYGCTQKIEKEIGIFFVPSATITLLSPSLFCDSAKVAFQPKVTSISPIKYYKWQFGDGDSSSLEKPTHFYSRPGRYLVQLEVETTDGCSDKKILKEPIVIAETPKLNPLPDTSFCGAGQVYLSAALQNRDTSVLTWNWDFAGNPDASAVNGRISEPGLVWFRAARKYDIKVSVENEFGCKQQVSRLVESYLVPDASVSVLSPTVFCDSGRVSFSPRVVSSVPIKDFRWNFGDGGTSSLSNPTHHYTRPGRYRVNLEMETANGCTDTKTAQEVVIVAETPKLNPLPDTSFCGAGQVYLRAALQNRDTSVLTWNWDFAGNPDASAVNGRIAEPGLVWFRAARKYDIKVSVENEFGCKQQVSRLVESYLVPDASVSVLSPTVFCDSGRVSFSPRVVSSVPIKDFRWNFGDGGTSSLSNPTHHYTRPGRYRVNLEMETANGCTDTKTAQEVVIVAETPKLNPLPDTSFCGAGQVYLRAALQNRDTSVLTWNWDFAGNPDASAVNGRIAEPGLVWFRAARKYDIKVSVENEFGCKQQVSRLVESYLVPDASVSVLSPTIFCDSGRVSFSPRVVSSVPIKDFRWNFGDGGTSSLSNPTHHYTRPGRYRVNLEMETANGCTDTKTAQEVVIVAETPKLNPLPDTSFCGAGQVYLRAALQNRDTSVLTWNWDFAGNPDASAVNGRIAEPGLVWFRAARKYDIKVSVENEFGCKQQVSRLVESYLVPDASVSVLSPTIFCDSGRVSFSPRVVSSVPIKDFRWNFGDGGTSSLSNPTHHYTRPGRYRVNLEMETANGCTDTKTAQEVVIVAETPKILLAADTAFCVSNRVLFVADLQKRDTSILKWEWDFAGNSDASSLNSGIAAPGLLWFRTPGRYPIKANVENEFGCKANATRIVSVVDTPKIVVNAPPILCRDQGVVLNASGAQGYEWSPAESLSCTNCPNPVANPKVNQIYRVTGYFENGVRCEKTVEVAIRVLQPFKAIVSKGDTLCVGESYQLTASGAQRYQWSPAIGLSATNIPNPVAKPNSSTTYLLVASDTANCFRDSVWVPLVVYPRPQVTIAQPTLSGAIGDRFLVRTNFSDVTRWRWTPTIGLSCSNCPTPEVTILQNQMKYKVTVTNPGGCEAFGELVVDPVCSSDLVFIPNTFSPNSDGKNDLFYPMSKSTITLKSFRIFNRWGQVVFERNGLNTNDPSAGWNGTFKGVPLTPDVYVYIAVVPCYNNQTLEIKGNVTLLK